ncbi:MAG: shikimate dehydrogenase [Flavobacteriaceae bacterium]|nr:shikimate dehydrogenase [Flavobacteriaceae bacterium]
MADFGLLGKNIAYSFSRSYFSKKFESENLLHTYVNFDLETIDLFPETIKGNPNLRGLNVTIPYKESVIPYLNKLNKKVKEIGAVNTIKFTKKGKLVGYNTDYYGFKNALKPYLRQKDYKALILGTGGASKAVAYALKKLNIPYQFVSRKAKNSNHLTYSTLDKNILESYQLIINCTPLGTFPNIDICPDLPYQCIGKNHILFDLIYNPSETKFLSKGKEHGALTINGQKMLELQAEKSWKIWNS